MVRDAGPTRHMMIAEGKGEKAGGKDGSVGRGGYQRAAQSCSWFSDIIAMSVNSGRGYLPPQGYGGPGVGSFV